MSINNNGGDGRGGPVQTSVIIAIIASVCFTAALITGLIALGRDPQQIIYFFGATLPSVIGLVALSRQTERVQKTADEARRVAESTNAKITNGLIPDKLQEAVERGILPGPRQHTERTRASDAVDSDTSTTDA